MGGKLFPGRMANPWNTVMYDAVLDWLTSGVPNNGRPNGPPTAGHLAGRLKFQSVSAEDGWNCTSDTQEVETVRGTRTNGGASNRWSH